MNCDDSQSEKCKRICDKITAAATESNGEILEGSDIVNAVIKESFAINIAIYIVMMIGLVILVVYAVHLFTRGRQSLNTLNINQGYHPVAQSWKSRIKKKGFSKIINIFKTFK